MPKTLQVNITNYSLLDALIYFGRHIDSIPNLGVGLLVNMTRLLDSRYDYANQITTFQTTEAKQIYTSELLLKELNRYESSFIDYLFPLAQDDEYLNNSAKLMDEIVLSDLPVLNDGETYVENQLLNFNYTRPFGNDEEKRFYIQRNVHGSLDQRSIIFGVDETQVGTTRKDPLFEFSKTFRIMAYSGEYYGQRRLLDGNIDVIKFYGHSLSDADYSYFQAMFDSIDLYSGNTQLYFYFRTWGNYDEQLLLRELSIKVSLLLERYGKSIDNTILGRNLLTKLNLEGRLHIKILGRLPQGVDGRKKYTAYDD